MYGLGCILFELAYGVKVNNYQDEMVIDRDLQQLFRKLLNEDPNTRFAGGWEDIKRQKFFHGVEWDDPGKINTSVFLKILTDKNADVK